MTNFNRFNTANIFEGIDEFLIVFNKLEIIFWNRKAEEKHQLKDWKAVFYKKSVQEQLVLFFESGKLPQDYVDPIHDLINGNQYITWSFKDLSINEDEKVCAAIGRILFNNSFADQEPKLPPSQIEEPFGNNYAQNNSAEQISIKASSSEYVNHKERTELEENERRYRILASNIPFTNVFLVDKDLNYILAEGPNFKYWG